jgi:hypothetical protein
VNYFPSIANDSASTSFVVAYYTHRFDTVGLENAQDIEMVTVDAATLTILKRQRVTDSNATPNETEADPTLGGFFIGDYIELTAHDGLAYIGYNMNTRNVAIFGEGVRIPQQDNFLSVVGT